MKKKKKKLTQSSSSSATTDPNTCKWKWFNNTWNLVVCDCYDGYIAGDKPTVPGGGTPSDIWEIRSCIWVGEEETSKKNKKKNKK